MRPFSAQESAVTSMVRVCCACGAQDKALKLVAEAQAAGDPYDLKVLTVHIEITINTQYFVNIEIQQTLTQKTLVSCYLLYC